MKKWAALLALNRFSSIAAFLATLALAPAAAFATNYLPGQTLDPSCLPTDATCIVVTSYSTSTNITVTSTASTSALVVSNSFTFGGITGFLKAVAGAVTTSLINLASDVTGILPAANGGTGTSTAPTYGQVLVGGSSGGYILTATSSLGLLASSSLSTSALLAGLVADHTGSGSLVFGTSPTIAGTPVFNGGLINYSVSSTSTIPNNTPYAWTVATSSSANPIINVDTSNGGSVAIGQAGASGSSILFGAINEPANLVFAASSTIEGGGTGQLITVGANSDIINFGVNVGIGTSSPTAPLTLNSTSTTGTILRMSNSSVGGHSWDLLSTGSGNTGGAGRLDLYDKTSGAARLSITATGNVGIGTTTPGSIFSISGVGNWTTATSTLYGSGGINITSGCYAINGACITGGGGGGGTNYFTLSGSNIYNNAGTNVGIDNTSPSYALDVGGFINTNSTSGGYKIDGNTVFYASSTIFGTFAGQGAAAGIISSATSSNVTSSPFATAFGYQALGNATSSGYRSTAIGYQALLGSATISNSGNNTAVGYRALTANTTGNANSAFGVNTLLSDTTGHNNNAFGVNSLLQNTTGNNNTAVGTNALNNNTTGGGNMALGFNTLLDNTTGGNNTAIGYQALLDNLSATSTVAIGMNAGFGNNLTYFNQGGTFLGYQSGLSVQTGSDYNTFLGYQSGYNLTTGSNNLILATATSSTAIANLTTGSQNILIGNNISLPSATANGQLNIGNIIFGSGNTAIGSNISTGNIGIGTTTPYSRLTVWGPDSAASTSAFLVSNSASTTEFAVLDNGNATLAGNLVQNSDQRLKTNIAPLDASSSLAAIDALNPVTFNWIDPAKGSTPQLGFIAQQVLPIFPNLISTTSPTKITPDGTLSLNYIGFIAPVVKAIQALSTEIASLENSIAGFAQSFTTKELTFTRATGQQLCLQKSDGTSACVTGDQLAAVLASENQSPVGGSPASSIANGSSASTDMPADIQINGNNPAIVQIGATYNDLGATIAGPQGDLNLGIKTFLNGTLTSNIVVDTSQAATDTIDYVVTDQNDLAATSTRTVIIQPAQPVNSVASTTVDEATSSSGQ